MPGIVRIYWGSLLSYALLSVVGCHAPSTQRPEASTSSITIATSANMQFAMRALIDQFTTLHEVDCEMVIGSSGKLTAQIKAGAPFDLFVSANMKYPKEIYESGLAQQAPEVYAYGTLVLWSMKEDLIPSLTSLKEESVRHIALANPNIAPYGIAAMEALRSYQLDQELTPKLVYGESIAQTNQFIITQSADIGFTAMSVVLSPQMKDKGKWVVVDEKAYSPIAQGIVMIKNQDPKALRFYQFLFSKEAEAILTEFGYSVVKKHVLE